MRVDISAPQFFLLSLANTFSSLKKCTVCADLPAFLTLSLITGESLRNDLLLYTENKLLYILELTVDFEANMQISSNCKVIEPSHSYNKVTFINLATWRLTIADIGITWIKRHLEMPCHNYTRRCLNIQGGRIVDILQLSKTKFGLDFIDVSTKFTMY